MVLDPDGDVQLTDRLFQVVPADAVGKDGDRLVQAARSRSFQWFASDGGPHRCRLRNAGDDRPIGAADPHLGWLEGAAECRIDHLGQWLMDGQTIAVVNFNEHVERRWRLAFEHRLLRSAAARLLVGERDGLDAPQQIVQGRVDQQVLQRIAVRRRHQLHAPLSDGARRRRLQLGADLVDDDHLWHVVLHRLDHHGVLQGGSADLHPSRATDPRMRDVSISADLIRGIDDYNALLHLVGEHAGALPQHRGLADPGATQEQDALSAYDHVLDDVDRAG